MTREVLEGIRALLETARVMSLSVLVDGEPEIGLLPYALSEDLTALYVQASSLARHSRGLRPGARVAVLIHTPDAPDQDPLQLKRLIVQATVRLFERETPEYAAAADRFIARFPAAMTTLALDDFGLYELDLGRGRYVDGFGRAFNVGPDTYADL
jgi:heme iron utilization protein